MFAPTVMLLPVVSVQAKRRASIDVMVSATVRPFP